MNLAWFTGEFQEMMALDMDCCCIATHSTGGQGASMHLAMTLYVGKSCF